MAANIAEYNNQQESAVDEVGLVLYRKIALISRPATSSSDGDDDSDSNGAQTDCGNSHTRSNADIVASNDIATTPAHRSAFPAAGGLHVPSCAIAAPQSVPTVFPHVDVLFVTRRARPTGDGFDWAPPHTAVLAGAGETHAEVSLRAAHEQLGLEPTDIHPIPYSMMVPSVSRPSEFTGPDSSHAPRQTLYYFAALKRDTNVYSGTAALGYRWCSLKVARQTVPECIAPLFLDTSFSTAVEFCTPAKNEVSYDLLDPITIENTHAVPWKSECIVV